MRLEITYALIKNALAVNVKGLVLLSAARGRIMLGFVLGRQGVLAVSIGTNANARGAKTSCCCAGCDFKRCSTPACWAKPNAPSAPVAAASLPSTTHNEFRAPAASLVSHTIRAVGMATCDKQRHWDVISRTRSNALRSTSALETHRKVRCFRFVRLPHSSAA